MFSTRTWRLMALIASIGLINALVLPVLGQTQDPTVEVSATDATASEEGLDTGVITLTRTGEVTSELDVDYTVTGTATPGDDYAALTGTATFGIGEATTIVTITPVDDTDAEGDETVILTLDADAAYTIGDDDQATVTIEDNEPTVGVTATDATATEEATTTGVFTFTRTGDLTAALDVHYTVTGTATAGNDYTSLTGTATIAAGAATTNIVVLPADDSIVEGNETVILTLDADADYTIGDDDQATVTIEDNDASPTVEVTATDATATEEGTTTGVFTFTRTGDLTAALLVDYTVTGTATAGSDYVALSGTASFAAGAATTTVVVTPIDDAVDEPGETVILTLDADADYTIGDDDQATVTIEDNDEADDDGQQEPPALVIPFDKSDCKKGGWMDFDVFKNQGDCVSFVATGGKNLPANLGDMTVDEWLESLDA